MKSKCIWQSLSSKALLAIRAQEFLNRILDQQGVAKDTHDLNDMSIQFEVVFNNCDEAVCDDGDTDLYSNSILGFSPNGFDAEMLLNPFEKQFNLPSVAERARQRCRRGGHQGNEGRVPPAEEDSWGWGGCRRPVGEAGAEAP